MSAENRMWKELNEKSLPPEEKAHRIKMCKNVIKIGASISLTFMIIGTLIVAKIATHYHGMIAVWIALIGVIIVSIMGVLLAYRIGNRAGKAYGIYIQKYKEMN